MSAHCRIPPVVPGTRPELAGIEQDILAQRGRISLLYQVLLNSAPVAAGWEKLLSAVRKQSTLPAHLRELAILRVAVLNRATFEFVEHVPHAKQAGLSEAQIAALRERSVADGLFDADERLMLKLTDAMTQDIEVPEALMDSLRRRFDARGVLEAVTTVAAYNMVSRLLVALDVRH